MPNVLKAYVLYDAENHVIPGSLMRRRKRPNIPNVKVLEVNSSLCCDGEVPIIQPGGTSKLKAYILFGSNNLALVGPIIRKVKPKGKGWRQIKYDLCCDTSITTPVITTQPEDQTVTDGEEANFLVVATGVGLTYQWLLNGVEILGATNSSYNLLEATLAMNGDEYSVVITNEAGSVTSETALLTVNPVTTTTSTTTSTTTTVAP